MLNLSVATDSREDRQMANGPGHGLARGVDDAFRRVNRQDQAAFLANIVDPSAVIRREYVPYIVTTTSGRVLTGLIAEQDGASVTILSGENKRIKLARDEIDELMESDKSLMPERVLESLSPQERRDLFSYLQK